MQGAPAAKAAAPSGPAKAPAAATAQADKPAQAAVAVPPTAPIRKKKPRDLAAFSEANDDDDDFSEVAFDASLVARKLKVGGPPRTGHLSPLVLLTFLGSGVCAHDT